MKTFIGWLLILIMIAAGVTFYLQKQKQGQRKYESQGNEKTLTLPEPPPEPAINYPLPKDNASKIMSAESSEGEASQDVPLPNLSESDKPLLTDLGELINLKKYGDLFYMDTIIHRFVVTVNNLTSSAMPKKYLLNRPVAGKFIVKNESQQNDGTKSAMIDPENYDRYDIYVKLLESVKASYVVGLYTHYYPLFQQAYESLGYPGKYFNDRLVEVVDNLLDAPVIHGDVKLIQPKVYYQFADPKLESLSAGQKIMLRMGPDNAERVKVVLREFRLELTK